MPTPFPGMDPYLERRSQWHAVHTRLIVAIADALTPQVRPRYRVDIELRTYVALTTPAAPVGVPDVLVMSPSGSMGKQPAETDPGMLPQLVEIPMPETVTERYLVVRDTTTQEVVTVIEVLSLANKQSGEGRTAYMDKRLSVLASKTHLVEIDLLRAGEPMPPFLTGDSDYRLLVSRSTDRPQASAYPFGLRDRIPDLPIPLRAGEREPILPLNPMVHELYERGGYDLAIDYGQPPVPPLRPQDEAWAHALLQR